MGVWVCKSISARLGSHNRVSPHCNFRFLMPGPGPHVADQQRLGMRHTCQKEFGLRSYAQPEPTCRGPGDSNVTCRFCNKVFQSLQARKNHERYIVHTLFRSNLLGYWGSSWWRQIHCHTCQKDCEKSDFEIQPSKILPQLVSSQHSGQVLKNVG